MKKTGDEIVKTLKTSYWEVWVLLYQKGIIGNSSLDKEYDVIVCGDVYTVEDKLIQYGYETVYSGIRIEDNLEVVIKMVNEPSAETYKNLRSEVYSALSTTSTKIIDWWLEDGKCCIVYQAEYFYEI